MPGRDWGFVIHERGRRAVISEFRLFPPIHPHSMLIDAPLDKDGLRRHFHSMRDRARAAHHEGDRLQVLSLCQQVLCEAKSLRSTGEFQPELVDLAWAYILAPYWAPEAEDVEFLSEHRSMRSRSPEDDLLERWLSCHWSLLNLTELELPGARYWHDIYMPDGEITISHAGEVPVFIRNAQAATEAKILRRLPWPKALEAFTPEGEALVTHLVELLWSHDPFHRQWQDVTGGWLETGPAWTHPLLRNLLVRLEVQGRLTAPESPEQRLTEEDVTRLKSLHEMGELWWLALQNEPQLLTDAVLRLAHCIPADSPSGRILRGFAGLADDILPLGNRCSYTSAKHQLQDIFPAGPEEKCRPSSERTMFLFHDRGRNSLTQLVGRAWQAARGPSYSHLMRQSLALARLHRLAALRLWDLWTWLDAVWAQALFYLELAQGRHPTDPSRGPSALSGLLLAARSGLELSERRTFSPAQSVLISRAVDALDLAEPAVAEHLAKALSAAYRMQKDAARLVLTQLMDLLPAPTWVDWAKWTIAEEAPIRRRWASRSWWGHVEMWSKIMPSVPAGSEVWAIWGAEMLDLVGGDMRTVLRNPAYLRPWLLCAPRSLAIAMADTLLTRYLPCHHGGLTLTELLIEFEHWHPDLIGVYTERLRLALLLPSEKRLLAEHLNTKDRGQVAEEMREAHLRHINDIPPVSCSGPFIGYVLSTEGFSPLTQWTQRDLPLIEALLTALNPPPSAEQRDQNGARKCLEQIVGAGPVEFAQAVEPVIVGALLKTRLAFVVIRKLGPSCSFQAQALEAVRELLLNGLGQEAELELLLCGFRQALECELELAVYGAAVLTLHSVAGSVELLMTILEAAISGLLARMDHAEAAAECLARALSDLASLIDTDLDESAIASRPIGEATTQAFAAAIFRISQRMEQVGRAVVREGLAAVVRATVQRCAPEGPLARTLAKLQKDARASVRFAAHGGWAGAKARALAGTKAVGADE